jgi:hypothetical protein
MSMEIGLSVDGLMFFRHCEEHQLSTIHSRTNSVERVQHTTYRVD